MTALNVGVPLGVAYLVCFGFLARGGGDLVLRTALGMMGARVVFSP